MHVNISTKSCESRIKKEHRTAAGTITAKRTRWKQQPQQQQKANAEDETNPKCVQFS